MKSLLRIVVAVVLSLLALPAMAAWLTNFTPPYGSNPAQCPTCMPDYAYIINNINTELASWLNFNNGVNENGEMAFASSSTFAPNGTTAVSAIGSVGPVTMTNGIVFEWLTIVDEGGKVGFIPVYR